MKTGKKERKIGSSPRRSAPVRRVRAGWARVLALWAVSLLMIGCDGAERNVTPARDGAPAPAERSSDVVLFLGTSLTAGYGLPGEQAYPARIQEKIDSAGLPFRVVNAGVSGETSAGALRRLDWLLRQPFDVLVLETGANDMLRGTHPDSTRANIHAMIRRVREQRPEARVILAGMLALPNLGREYGQRFETIYRDVARQENVTLVPFLLEGVATEPRLNLADGIHPNEAGQRHVARTVWAALEPVLREEAGR
ncbi:MAG: arylesterase [Gemmatimonadetes bacterium]|nr:arylesterase [Gemmatimonadota bacterium]